MSKFSNMLFMIDILNTGNLYPVKDLAQKLDVSERMVRYYKNEISNSGINIESFKGPNGGYFMISKITNYTNLDKYDIQLLKASLDKLKDTNFEFVDKYKNLIEKLENIYSIAEEKSKFITEININEKSNIEKIIIDCIKKSEKIHVVYLNTDGSKTKRVIHPLYFFKYKDLLYVTAYCELRNDIRHFEINRIIKIIKT